MKKRASLFLALALTLGLVAVPTSAAGGKFKDTSGHWAEAAIDRWSGYGVVQGSEGMFDPNGQLTRAQIATILSNTLGLTDQTAVNPFADLDTTQWYAAAILRCHAAGLMQGDGVNVNPNAILTRQEAMVLLGRALDISPISQYNLSSFSDAGQVDDWAAPYVCAMTSAGIVNGTDPGVLSPKGEMTRASLMTVLDRSIVQYVNRPGSYTLSAQDGIILIAAGNVTLSGATPSDVLVTRAASGKSIAFNGARITGGITVEANNATVTSQNSTLPTIRVTGKNTTLGPATPQPTPTPTAKPDLTSDKVLTITEKKDATYEDGVYKTVKLDSVLKNNNAITLKDMTVQGDLIIRGGCGSSSKPLTLTNCDVQGKIVVDRSSSNTVYIVLNKSSVAAMEADTPVSVETKDKNCSMGDVTVLANTTFKGSRTSVKSILVPANAEDDVTITVEDGTVSALETEARTDVTLKGNVKEITSRGNFTFSGSCEVSDFTVPSEVEKAVAISLSSDSSIGTLHVNTTVKVTVRGEVGAVIEDRDFIKKHKVTVGSDISDEPHNWNSSWSSDATYHWHKCKVKNCDAKGSKTEHSFNSGKVTTAATCTRTGVRTYTCSVCNYSKTETIAKTNHTYKNGKCTVCGAAEQGAHVHSYTWVKVDDANHKGTCKSTTGTCTAKEVTEAHTWGSDNKCSKCGADKPGTPPTPGTCEHTWGAGEETKAPTCAEKGEKTYTCSKCKETKTEEIPATGNHSWGEWETVKEPTATEAGEKKRACSVCGKKETESIPATGEEPGGGDDNKGEGGGDDNKGEGGETGGSESGGETGGDAPTA